MPLVVIASFTSVHEAALAQSVLRAAGVDATLADEHVVSLTMYSNAVGGVKVLVPEERAEEARALLESTATIVDGSPDESDSA